MKYAWAIILVIVDLVWICFTIYDFAYSTKLTKEYIKDKYLDREPSLFTWLGEFFSEIEGASIYCVVCNVLALFVYSLVLYVKGLG